MAPQNINAGISGGSLQGSRQIIIEHDKSTMEDREPGTTEWLPSSFIMTNVVIGVGLLNFPAAYRDVGGVTAALLVQLVCVIFIMIGEFLICECADVSGSNTYQDTVDKLCGKLALVVCNLFILIEGYGSCVTLMVILGDQLDGVLWLFMGTAYCESWFLQRFIFLPVISCVFILPNIFWRKMDSFKITSYIGVLATGYIVFLTMWKFFTAESTALSEINHRPKSLPALINVMPTVCVGFEGHIEAVILYAGFRKRDLWELSKTVFLSTFMCLLIYSLTGVFGYLTFGDDVTTDILTSYRTDWLTLVALIITAVKSVTAYPALLYCVRIMVEQELMRLPCWRALPWTDLGRRAAVSAGLFVISLLIAVLVPTIGSIITLLGGWASLFSFVLPGLCYMQLHKDGRGGKTYLRLALSLVMVSLGVTILVASMGRSVIEFSSVDYQPERPCARL